MVAVAAGGLSLLFWGVWESSGCFFHARRPYGIHPIHGIGSGLLSWHTAGGFLTMARFYCMGGVEGRGAWAHAHALYHSCAFPHTKGGTATVAAAAAAAALAAAGQTFTPKPQSSPPSSAFFPSRGSFIYLYSVNPHFVCVVPPVFIPFSSLLHSCHFCPPRQTNPKMFQHTQPNQPKTQTPNRPSSHLLTTLPHQKNTAPCQNPPAFLPAVPTKNRSLAAACLPPLLPSLFNAHIFPPPPTD